MHGRFTTGIGQALATLRRPRSPVVPIALAVTALVATSCGSTPTAPSTTAERPTVKLATAHFQILGDRAGAAVLAGLADALESEYARITSDLRVSGLQPTSVYVWQDSTSFYEHMRTTAGTVWQGAAGWVPGPHTVSILVVSESRARASAVHEFAHVLSLGVNPTFGNRPRWLWETVALYENRELVDPRTLDYMRNGQYPSLAELDSPYGVSGRVYQVGYVLGEYIVQAWGLDGLVRLIQRNGDLTAALGVTTAAFEAGWHVFLHDKYGLPGNSSNQFLLPTRS